MLARHALNARTLASRRTDFRSRKVVGSRAVAVRSTGGDPRPSALDVEGGSQASSPAKAVTSSSAPSEDASGGGLIAGAAVAAGVALFAATKLAMPGPSLAALEGEAIPLDMALRNGKPTVMEFYAGKSPDRSRSPRFPLLLGSSSLASSANPAPVYTGEHTAVSTLNADWCKVCQLMTGDTYEVERAHRGDVNFVMLNVDNPKWAPEIAEIGVPGIPEYVFLDGNGKIQAVAVGQVPKNVLEGDFDALAKGQRVPFANVTSDFTEMKSGPGAGAMKGPKQSGPLDHA